MFNVGLTDYKTLGNVNNGRKQCARLKKERKKEGKGQREK